MTKSDRIDPLVHYSRQVRQLLTEKERMALAIEYLAALAWPYLSPNEGPADLIYRAYEHADQKLHERE